MWGKSSNSHLGKSDTTVALILYQKEKINPKMLVHFISDLVVLGEVVPWLEGKTQRVSILHGWLGSPRFIPYGWVSLFELYLIIFQPYSSEFDSGS